jgi:hypothetical protein
MNSLIFGGQMTVETVPASLFNILIMIKVNWRVWTNFDTEYIELNHFYTRFILPLLKWRGIRGESLDSTSLILPWRHAIGIDNLVLVCVHTIMPLLHNKGMTACTLHLVTQMTACTLYLHVVTQINMGEI